MAKKKYDEEEGVWRTIGGRRVFIKKGQSLSDAMKESGKFKSNNPPKNETPVPLKNDDDKLVDDFWKKYNKMQSEKQFNRQVDLDKDLKNWMKENDLKYEVNGNEYKLYKGDKQISYLAVDNSLSADIKNKKYLMSGQIGLNDRDDLSKETKSIHTQSGSYTPSELKTRDESIKQLYKDTWNGNKSYKDLHNELEQMKASGKVSQGELDSLQYDASMESNKKFPRAVGSKDFSEYGIRIEDEGVKERFSDYLRDKYGTDDFEIINFGNKEGAKNIYTEFNNQELKKYQERMLNDDNYLQANRPHEYNRKMIEEGSEKKREFGHLYNGEFESKRVSEEDIKEKGYQYFSTHGVGPGTLPKDVRAREVDGGILSGGWTTYKTDRPLNQKELDYYDIQPETRNSEFRKRFGLNDNSNVTKEESITTKYKGTIDYLKETTDMSEAEIIDLLKKRGKK